MAIQVKLPNGEIGEFPDNMSDEEIQSVLQKQFPPTDGVQQEAQEQSQPQQAQPQQPPQEKLGWGGLADDAMNYLSKVLGGAVDMAVQAPSDLGEIGSELVKHPLSAPPHNAQQMLAGMADTAKDIINLPYKGIAELGRKEIIPKWLADYNEKGLFGVPFTHIPEDTGVEKMLGLQPTKQSDQLLRAAPGLLMGGREVFKGGKKLGKVLEKPTAAQLAETAIQDKIKLAEKEHGIAGKEKKELGERLREDFSNEFKKALGGTEPISQTEAINIAKGKLEDYKPATEIPEKEVGEIPAEPDTKTMIEDAKQATKDARGMVEGELGVLDMPRQKAGQFIGKKIKEVRNTANDLYNKARAHYADKNVMADNHAEIKAVTEELEALKDADELAPGYGIGTPKQKALETTLDSLKSEKVKASDLFDLQRTLEKMAKDTRTKMNSGVSDLEYKQLKKNETILSNHAAKIESRLEAVGGKEVQSIIKEANKGWKTYKDLSEWNPIGKGAVKGEIPTRSLVELANNHSGNQFLKSLIDNNPELKKNMLAAYTGESNVNKLTKPNTLVKEYLDALPEVQDKLNDFQEALKREGKAKTESEGIKKEYDALVKSMKEAAKEQQTRQQAIKESDSLKKQIKFREDAIPKLEEKIKREEAAGNDVKKYKQELEDHKAAIANKRGRLKKLGAGVLKTVGAAKLLGRIGL